MALLESGLKTIPSGTQGWNLISTENMETLDTYLKQWKKEETTTTDAVAKVIATITTQTTKSYLVQVTCIGIKDDTNYAHYQHTAAFYHGTSTLAQNGSTVKVVDIDSAEGWGGLTFVCSGSDIELKVTGKLASTIKWYVDYKVILRGL